MPRLLRRPPDTLPYAKTGNSVSIHPGAGRRSIYPNWQAGHNANGLAGGGQTMAAEKRTDQNPDGGKSVTQFLSENGS